MLLKLLNVFLTSLIEFFSFMICALFFFMISISVEILIQIMNCFCDFVELSMYIVFYLTVFP